MIGARAKDWFFDRPAVIARTTAAERKVLLRQGSILKLTARRSMRYKRGASPPGTPPHAHEGSMRRLLYSPYDPASKSVVVGSEKFANSKSPYVVPEALEYGRSGKTKNKNRRPGKIGSVGVIAIGSRATGKTVRSVRPKNERKSVNVAFAKIHTQAQLARSEAFAERLWGKEQYDGLAARPYMAPALEKVKDRIAACWRDAIK